MEDCNALEAADLHAALERLRVDAGIDLVRLDPQTSACSTCRSPIALRSRNAR
jgi:hypothetical protein